MNGAVVVLFNPNEKDLKNILCYAYKVDKTLIVDNSINDNKNILLKYFEIDNKKIFYKHNEKNIGLCKAMNEGITFLNGLGCKWVLTMDFDSSFKSEILSVYQHFIENNDVSDVAILSPQYYYDRTHIEFYKGVKEVDWKMLSGCFLNTKIFTCLNGFKEFFFVDGLDMEYCLHAREEGFRVIECGEAILNHKPAITRKINFLGKTLFKYGYASPIRYRYQARSLIWICIEYKNINIFLIYLYKLFKILFLFDNKLEFIRNFVKGTEEGVLLRRRC